MQECSNVLFAMWRLNWREDGGKSGRKVYVEAVRKVGQCNPLNCANILLAAGQLGVSDKASAGILLQQMLTVPRYSPCMVAQTMAGL